MIGQETARNELQSIYEIYIGSGCEYFNRKRMQEALLHTIYLNVSEVCETTRI
jgi:hypothetical protein